jgi:DNA repair protein RadC
MSPDPHAPIMVRELETRYRPGTASRRAKGAPISAPRDAAAAILAQAEPAPVERFACLILDTKHRPIAWLPVSSGTQDAALVHPRDVYRAILAGPVTSQAAGLILTHNHPSGDPTPSGDDRQLTDRMQKAGALLGVDVIDHIITTADGRYHSMKEHGQL